jgi:hypothetical protein
MRRMMIAVVALLALAGPAAANDSSAELRQGGLVLVHNPGIEMRAEDLFISPSAVKVRYRFLNTTGRDQRVLVAFPMPDITIEGPDDLISIPRQDPQNFLGFSTTVDGRPVAARIEQKVISRGVDRTTYLKSLGVPLAPQLPATRTALDRLPKPVGRRLVSTGLAISDDYDAGKGWEHHLQPTWTLKTTYYWDQVFPAGRELAVAHDYAPSVGGTSGTAVEGDGFRTSPDYRRMTRKYCLDQDFMSAVASAKRAVGHDHQAFFEKRIEYVLSSGANWKAPIGDFRLVVDKGRPDSLVSFCMDGVKRIAPTRFEVRKTAFRPTRDLSILILEPAPKGY